MLRESRAPALKEPLLIVTRASGVRADEAEMAEYQMSILAKCPNTRAIHVGMVYYLTGHLTPRVVKKSEKGSRQKEIVVVCSPMGVNDRREFATKTNRDCFTSIYRLRMGKSFGRS